MAPMLDDALRPLAPGPLLRIGEGPLQVDIAPAAGGRVARMVFDGVDWLIGYSDAHAARIAWGSYPMLPWAGRIRAGRFACNGKIIQLPLNLGPHAIHGVAFGLPWRVARHWPDCVELEMDLPNDARWPFGGTAWQRLEVAANRLRMELCVRAGIRAMPVTLGWHPWFRKPDRLQFDPEAAYARDSDGITIGQRIPPPAGPWDDCFSNRQPVLLHRAGQVLQLRSDCQHWVVYDQPDHATCVEPQSGPPDGFNLEPTIVAPGESLQRWFELEWVEALPLSASVPRIGTGVPVEAGMDDRVRSS